MSSGSAPVVTTTRLYRGTIDPSTKTFTITSSSIASRQLYDYDDGNGDDLGIFGDVPNDQVWTKSPGSTSAITREYVGYVGNREGYLFDWGTSDFLYTDKVYQVGAVVSYTDSSIAVCFVSGTSIKTTAGEVSIENLAIGDLVATASCAPRPIRWIGHRTLSCRGRKDVLPVRIAAHAFGEGRPARDLFVSPAHAIAVDVLGEVLIPACRLINGTTITQVAVETVTYWHVELDSHDILLAEGLPAESYLDRGNRGFFANAEVTDLAALPDAHGRSPLPFCRPLHEVGPLVDLVRARLEEQATALGWRRAADTFAGMHLVADGRVINPDTEGLTARFVLPTEAATVRLVSQTSVPAHVKPGSTDDRRLGLPIAALVLDDGLTGARAIAVDDERLGTGFHAAEAGLRWTDGAAVLPAELWAGCRGTVFLRVILAGPALPGWVAPCGMADRVGPARSSQEA